MVEFSTSSRCQNGASLPSVSAKRLQDSRQERMKFDLKYIDRSRAFSGPELVYLGISTIGEPTTSRPSAKLGLLSS